MISMICFWGTPKIMLEIYLQIITFCALKLFANLAKELVLPMFLVKCSSVDDVEVFSLGTLVHTLHGKSVVSTAGAGRKPHQQLEAFPYEVIHQQLFNKTGQF